jgi:hypothetical protein
LKDVQGVYGSLAETKQSTYNSSDKVLNTGLDQSMSYSMYEELKSETSTRKDEAQSPQKFSLQSCGLDDKNIEKKSKQERNRESAKKCRQRKKEYMYKMEAELKAIRQELALCKYELAILKGDLLSGIEQQYVNLKEGLLAQAKNILEEGADASKLEELLNHFNVY